MPRAALLVSWLAMALTPTTASAGACAQPPPVYQVLTATDVEISGGGGIVAQIDNFAKPPAWRFEGQQADVSVRPIAPGLATIELPKAKRWVTLGD
ncbi:MAG TPA: hypothetical protein VFQ65_26310, partial [Kofleriaceae bacterium]|nr:hypothetical protein [Kofleriaceae bacterium]